jgi:SNF2 family DNA or RNA helicase
VVFLDRNWSPSKNRQAEDRAHRIGQRESVQIIDLVARDTIDMGRLQKLELKWDWLRQILGDKRGDK